MSIHYLVLDFRAICLSNYVYTHIYSIYSSYISVFVCMHIYSMCICSHTHAQIYLYTYVKAKSRQFLSPQILQDISCYCQREAGNVVEHGVSVALGYLRDMRLEVIQPVCQVGIWIQAGPTSAEAHTPL